MFIVVAPYIYIYIYMKVKVVEVLGSQVFDTSYKTFVVTEYFLYILVLLCLARYWF